MDVKRVETVLGPIRPEEMGITDSHDHLIRIGGAEVTHDKDFLLNNVENAAQEMKEFHAAGGRTLVDCMTYQCGRDVEMLIQVSRASGVHVIATAGFLKAKYYLDKSLWIHLYSVEQIADLLAAEVLDGLDRFNYCGPIVERLPVKAGVFKFGTSYQAIHPIEAKWMKAVAIAHKKCGAPIITHTEYGTMAMEQSLTLQGYGVNPEQIILSHIDRNPDFDYHREVAKTGVFLEYDGPARVKYWSDNFIVDLILRMVDVGFEKQILLGLDLGRASYWKTNGGGPSFCYILDQFVPKLRRAGLPQDVIDGFLIHNPARAFAF